MLGFTRGHLSRRVDLNSYNSPTPTDVPTMITTQEMAALSCFAERCWDRGARRESIIIDAGCFVGASTTAFAQGLKRSSLSEKQRQGKIWSYDLFVALDSMSRDWFKKEGIPPGGSFLSSFEANTKPFSEYLHVLPGDIADATEPDKPISVLFVDVLWSPTATEQFGKTFYPKVEKRRSVLIHQDFVYPYYPWLVLSMGLLSHQLPFAYQIPYSSVVFDVAKKVLPRDIDDIRNVGKQRGEAIFDMFISRVDGWGKGALAISKSLWLGQRGDLDQVKNLVPKIVGTYIRV